MLEAAQVSGAQDHAMGMATQVDHIFLASVGAMQLSS
jgi:hypothetical protein